MRILRHPHRLSLRLLWLFAELIMAAFAYIPAVARRGGERNTAARARWLQQSCRRVLRILNANVRVQGTAPTSGLLVCNHLSYLDVLVLGALTPAIFVAKRQVKRWPVFGWFAALAGTVFVDRERRTQAGQATAEIQAVLDHGQLLVLFPEGTSSDGNTVLPFKSSLLEPATKTTWPLSAGALRYELEDGDVGEEVCYWKDMTFFPHLLNLLTKGGIVGYVDFLPVKRATTCRKTMAQQLHSVVSQLNSMGVTQAQQISAIHKRGNSE